MATILIADDEPSLRLLVGATISSDDNRVVEATNGDEAWDLLPRERPAVAVLDVSMPGRTGIEAPRAIRADPNLAATRVILLTAKAQPAGLAAGADHYLTKPFSPLELLTLLEQTVDLI